MNLLFIGPPGSGKGTQSKLICERYNLRQLSTGDILRENIAQGTELGAIADTYISKGQFLPDDIMIDLIEKEFQKMCHCDGFIFDGFPRTIPQADAFDLILQKHNSKLDVVLVLDVIDDELIHRLTARRTCPKCGASYHLMYNPPKNEGICDVDNGELYQRDDDKEVTIARRLEIYHARTKPLIEYFEKFNLTRHIDGMLPPNVVFEKITEVLDKYR